MKIKIYITMILLAFMASSTFISCNDDDFENDAPRLFRPVASLEVQNNNIVTTWKNIKGATEYQLQLYRVTSIDDAGNNVYELYTEASCQGSPYTFEGLNWDEKYMVKIKCKGSNIESELYTTTDINVTYISKIKSLKLIDNAARLTWEKGGSTIRLVKAVPATEGLETITKEVSEAEYANGSVDITGLTSEVSYTIYAYSSVEEQNNATYAGKMTGKTTAPIDFDALFGAGNWIDIRSYDDVKAVDTLKTKDFWLQITNGMTIILRGDFDYKVNNTIQFDRSVTFRTAATLGGNARFVSSGGLQCSKNVTVDKIMFENVDFYSDYALPGGGKEVATTDDKGFGGRQVFNENGTNSTIKELIFKGCHIEGYRAVVRAQGDNDNITNLTFDGCTINGVGDQGIVTTSNKKADWKNVTFKDCTITNIVMMGDLRASASELTVNVENCTFCYAPMETTANANTPLFRCDKNAVVININKTLFGPSMATEGSAGSKIKTYTAGTAGSLFLNASAALVSTSQSFKTNFKWTELGEAKTTYPIDGLIELSFDEKALWQGPEKGDYKIIGNIGESGIGASKWQ
nr:right-handed parallel beta-helix repeat-containing protein [Bacteroides intestinalis]